MLTLIDAENSYLDNGKISAGFALNNENVSTLGQATLPEESITCLHDKWNLYVAKEVADGIVKIERWHKFIAGDEYPFCHEEDVAIIDTASEEIDFEWFDDSHNGFIITMKDESNLYWDEYETVAFY